jgi:hypothetical protein
MGAFVCRICGITSTPWDTALVLKKYQVQYFRCEECGFIETEYPYWLEDAYSEAIADTDLGLIAMNVSSHRITKRIITVLFNANEKFIDYGGGYGILTRLMRDAGFEFYRSDKYCPNLFAKGFDAGFREAQRYELVTAYEVFEHLQDPAETLKEMCRLSRNILFTTCLIPFERPPKASEWWYYALGTGQHISFYTHQSLSVLAARAKLNLYSHGSVHLFTEKRISPIIFSMLSSHRAGRIIELILPRRMSLLAEDAALAAGAALGGARTSWPPKA